MDNVDRRFVLKAVGASVVLAGSGAAMLWPRLNTAGQAKPGSPKDGAAIDDNGAQADCSAQKTKSAEPAPWWLIAPLEAGSPLRSFRLVGMAQSHGIVNIELEKGGESFTVRLTRRDESPDAPRPLANSARYEFFLANGGKGNKPTDEEQGLAVLTLAAMVKKNEQKRGPLPLVNVREWWRRCGA